MPNRYLSNRELYIPEWFEDGRGLFVGLDWLPAQRNLKDYIEKAAEKGGRILTSGMWAQICNFEIYLSRISALHDPELYDAFSGMRRRMTSDKDEVTGTVILNRHLIAEDIAPEDFKHNGTVREAKFARLPYHLHDGKILRTDPQTGLASLVSTRALLQQVEHKQLPKRQSRS